MASEKEPFTEISILSIIDIVKKNLGFELINKGLKISIEIPEDIGFKVQQTLMLEAIQNLVSNAIKFSPTGEVITLRAEKHSSSISIIVQDNGIGFNPENAEQLFNRFAKVGRKGTNNEPSTARPIPC